MYYLIYHIKTKVVQSEIEETPVFEVNDPWGLTTNHVNKIIYEEYLYFTADNHFTGNHALELAGEMGFALTVTRRRDYFPKGLNPISIMREQSQVIQGQMQ